MAALHKFKRRKFKHEPAHHDPTDLMAVPSAIYGDAKGRRLQCARKMLAERQQPSESVRDRFGAHAADRHGSRRRPLGGDRTDHRSDVDRVPRRRLRLAEVKGKVP